MNRFLRRINSTAESIPPGDSMSRNRTPVAVNEITFTFENRFLFPLFGGEGGVGLYAAHLSVSAAQ
jgi:hypothetical protein